MSAIVPLIFLAFVLPGVVHGFIMAPSARTATPSRHEPRHGQHGLLLVLVFFAAQLSICSTAPTSARCWLKGASFLREIGGARAVAVGLIVVATFCNLVIGSVWPRALLAPSSCPCS
jgi:aminobenzoyl-glutamate transport protein